MTLGGFFGSDTTDLLLRNSRTGAFEVYDVSNNNITNAASLGAVGLNWQVMGFGNFSSRGENDMIRATRAPAGSRSTISRTIKSPAPPSWAPSA